MTKTKTILGLCLLALLAATLALAGCTARHVPPSELPDIPNQPPTPPGENIIGGNNVVVANNQFAIDLYEKYSSNAGNIFFSPYSISTALAMTYEGAHGQTAEEMQEVFQFPGDDATRREGYQALYKTINLGSDDYQLSTANALWAQEDFPFNTDYLSLVDTYYDGEANSMDFKNNPEPSRIEINDWVAEQTEDKIQDLIPAGIIKPITRLVLTNAIYFKGEWVQQFNEDDTRERIFRITPDNAVQVQTMKRTDAEAVFGYVENDLLQILEMSYSGEELSMLVLLPKNDDMSAVEESLTIENLVSWKDDIEEQRVNVYLPKFKFETKYLMAQDLEAMGMPLAFSDDADFTGMENHPIENLKISQVIHQAFVEVNEEGTEAAAATAVIMETITSVEEPSGPVIPTFRADHPFIFIIQHRETGTILFIGRVNDPR